ncbi:tetratricopeptide repeat protein [Olivibacter sp. CPCC 100613]|uniref:tetratricopeptide repeat protein n=1 Tax=Olivibacter sp. CPCC 100613 TaxID=3079931 RepID=UPI002FFBD086
MQKILKYTLVSCLVMGFAPGVKGKLAKKRNGDKGIVSDTVSVKSFTGIGPVQYELPPEKTKEQLLREAFDQKHIASGSVTKELEERDLNIVLQQTGQYYPLPSNTANSTMDLETSLQRSLQSYLQIGNMEMVSNLQNRLALLYVKDKRYEKAIGSFERALAIKAEINDFHAQAIIASNLGALYEFLDNTDRALFYYDLMNKNALRAKSVHNEAVALEHLAVLKARKGQFKEAQHDIIKRVLPLYKKEKNVSGRVSAYNSLAAIYLLEKKYTESRWFHLQAVKVASLASNSQRDMSYSLYHLGKVKKLLKEYELAITDYTSAAAYALQAGDEMLRLRIYDDLGDVYLKTENYTKASEYLTEYHHIKNRLFPASDVKVVVSTTKEEGAMTVMQNTSM